MSGINYMEDGKAKMWNGKLPKKYSGPLHDGDIEQDTDLAFDEYTSVVDREVAENISIALHKTILHTDNKKVPLAVGGAA